jgi:MoxR-like ATPase
MSDNTLATATEVIERLRARLRAGIVGRDAVIELVMLALFADGHVLLEDYPGSGKTTLAKVLGDSVVDDAAQDDIAPMRRIQFTPDLLPSDVTGTTIFDPDRQTFFFRAGPLFAHVVLADEINRTSPKVQAALLEAMAEKQITIDNQTRKLDDLFFVIATQNPLDLAGTFPLPAAQLDRFLFKIRMEPIAREHERGLLDRLDAIKRGPDASLPRVTRSEVLAVRAASRGVFVAPALKDALVDVAAATRASSACLQGVSTRSLVLLLPALQVAALLDGRDHATEGDLARLAPVVFAHRLMLAPGAPPAAEVVRACAEPAIERLARQQLRRA